MDDIIEDIEELFDERQHGTYKIVTRNSNDVYIGRTRDMYQRWHDHLSSTKLHPGKFASSKVMLQGDAYYVILSWGFNCKWDAQCEEQRQLDLHPNKVNLYRAIALPDRRHNHAQKPEVKARKAVTDAAHYAVPENREKKRIKDAERAAKPEEKYKRRLQYRTRQTAKKAKDIRQRHMDW